MNSFCRYLYILMIAMGFFLPMAMSAQVKSLTLLREQLDSAVDMRMARIADKEKHILQLKTSLAKTTSPEEQLPRLDEIYQEYYVFQFDSALTYVNRGLALAKRLNNKHYIVNNTIQRARLLAIGGLYSESSHMLEGIEEAVSDTATLFSLYISYFQLYNYWHGYCVNTDYSDLYLDKAKDYLRRALDYLPSTAEDYDYYMGEYYTYVEDNHPKAREHYKKAISSSSPQSRTYAMSCFALAGNYGEQDPDGNYERYMIMACIADLQSCIMENSAMQIYALQLFGQREIEKADRYINASMADASFYNNRLRKIEISQKLPLITNAHQLRIKQQNSMMRWGLMGISLLVITVMVALFWIYLQNKKLNLRRLELASKNTELTSLNGELSALNIDFAKVNERLVKVNTRRERLAKIYIDLCAKYIDRLTKYQKMVMRKIKTNQVNDLLTQTASYKLSQEDASIFLTRFDKAFLDLYPEFVAEFNALLKPEHRIQVDTQHSLTPDLRIFALIRLGVRDSSEIAGLLFYSIQTIYNYRSLMRAKALSPESFEEDVTKLA